MTDTEAKLEKLKKKRHAYTRLLTTSKTDTEFFQKRIEELDREIIDLETRVIL